MYIYISIHEFYIRDNTQFCFYQKLINKKINKENICVCSPEEVYQAFQAHRVSEGQFAEQGPVLVSRPSLMCRLGDRILPWPQAAPVVMGVLAFGGDWQHLLLPDQGVPIAVPLQQFQGSQPGPGKVRCTCSIAQCVCHLLSIYGGIMS